MSGEMALESLQVGLESTRGTPVAATRIEPILGGTFAERIPREFPAEARGTFVPVYRDFPTGNHVEVSGVQVAPTFEGLPWWLNLFVKGGVTSGSTVHTSGKSYTFSPTAASDDLKTATFECVYQQQNYTIPFVLGNRLELGWGADQAMSLSMDFLGQKMTAQAKTAALSAVDYEDIIGSKFSTYVDGTTIGTTAVYGVYEGRLTINNNWVQEFVGDGNLHPRDAHRNRPEYSLQLSMYADAAGIAEYGVWKAGTSGQSTMRKIRVNVSGTDIAGSSPTTPRTLRLDWYGGWDTAEPIDKDGKRAFQFTSRGRFDTGASLPFQIYLESALATLP